MKDHVVYWPDQDERDEMKSRLSAHGFHHCVGIIDGTLVFLDCKPPLHSEAYYNRKGGYAVNFIVVCDDQTRVIYQYGGWPGCSMTTELFLLAS